MSGHASSAVQLRVGEKVLAVVLASVVWTLLVCRMVLAMMAWLFKHATRRGD